DQAGDGADQFRTRSAKRLRDVAQEVLVFFQTLVSPKSGQGLNPSNAGGDTGFQYNLEKSDAARHFGVGSAAQLHTDVGNRNDADLLCIFLAEKRHCAGGEGLIQSHNFGFNGQILKHDAIDLLFDLLDFTIRERGEMRVIEAEAVWRDERSGLLDMSS